MINLYASLSTLTARWRRDVARLRNDHGVTSVEYGLMVALIAIVIITAVALVGTNLSSLFNTIAGDL